MVRPLPVFQGSRQWRRQQHLDDGLVGAFTVQTFKLAIRADGSTLNNHSSLGVLLGRWVARGLASDQHWRSPVVRRLDWDLACRERAVWEAA